MALGRYTLLGEDGSPVGTEDFRCAPGPMGWRYVSTIVTSEPHPHDEQVDLVADASWRPVRVRIDTGAHELLAEPQGHRLVGTRDGGPLDVRWGDGVEIDYASPAFNVVTANRYARTVEFDVVFLDPFTIEPADECQRYELLGEERVTTPVGVFEARRWRFTALPNEFTALMWISGDVVVRYEGLYELGTYDPGATGPRPVA